MFAAEWLVAESFSSSWNVWTHENQYKENVSVQKMTICCLRVNNAHTFDRECVFRPAVRMVVGFCLILIDLMTDNLMRYITLAKFHLTKQTWLKTVFFVRLSVGAGHQLPSLPRTVHLNHFDWNYANINRQQLFNLELHGFSMVSGNHNERTCYRRLFCVRAYENRVNKLQSFTSWNVCNSIVFFFFERTIYEACSVVRVQREHLLPTWWLS